MEADAAQAGAGAGPPAGNTHVRRRVTMVGARYPDRNWSQLIASVCIVGPGRVGQAALERLRGRVGRAWATGREHDWEGAELVLLCVPDRAVPEVAAAITPGPWVAHVSGALRLDALEPHVRRLSLHPLQTFQAGLGPGQFDGSFAALTAETTEAHELGLWLAEALGLQAFDLGDADRPAYHAAATMAATFLVTLHGAAGRLMESAGAPASALEPLMRRTIDNGFAPTGPFVRGDEATVESHLAAIAERVPSLEPLYRCLAAATREAVLR